tara:strand:+ start:13643 stop:16327 length:2685 start_codon:yes stop_codon:yes gene_type:complete
MIKIAIGNQETRILGNLPEVVHRDLDKALSYKLANARFMKSKKNPAWDGTIRLYKKNRGQSFYTGLISIACEVLDKHELKYQRFDQRKRPNQNIPDLTFSARPGYEERDYQKFTIDRSFDRTRGILKAATGSGKCLGEGTPIMMFDGSIKNVEEVNVGDRLMGPDSTPRTVLSTTTGIGPLYEVSQKNGDNYICNDAHILCLERTTCPSRGWNEKKNIEITADEFHASSKWFKHTHKGYKVGVTFPKQKTLIDPYFLGLWLGDGDSSGANITTNDNIISNYLKEFAAKNKLEINMNDSNGERCPTYRIIQKSNTKKKCSQKGCNKKHHCGSMCKNHYQQKVYRGFRVGGKIKNPLLDNLRALKLIKNKHIPDIYKYNCRKSRLQLLAGLIDADGSSDKIGSMEITSIRKSLAEDICWLARSLGFRASLNTKKTSIKKIDYIGKAYRVLISGSVSEIPIKLKYKCLGDKTKYSALRYGIKLSPIGKGTYFGFEIDGDRKFLLGDFTVTHNTQMVTEIIGKIKTAPFMFYVLTQDLMDQAHDTLSSSLNIPIGKIGAGEFDVQDINVCTIQTAVQCINKNNKAFKISDYQFDDEDEWDKDQIISEDKLEHMTNLLRSVKGLYFDEAHHASAKTVTDVILSSPNAFWRYGGSATPYREDGAEMMIQALFGKKIVDINASYLIDRDFLLEPYILFEPIEHETKFKAYKTIYRDCISANDRFNSHVADQANHLVANEMSTLVLVKEFAQGDYINSKVPNAQFVTSRMSKKNRRQAIQDLRDRKYLCMIATSLADEGLDVPTLDAALLAGGGASENRFHQRVGRTLRIDKGSPYQRDKSLVIYYDHKVRHLEKHAKKARKIAKTEPRFNVVESAGPNAIIGEMNEIMGLEHSKEKTIFDI